MRSLTLAFLALSTTACSGEALHLEYQSTLWNETSGVVMHDDTARGHGSMLETTCEFDMATGAVTGDVDLPTASEVISDVVDGAVLAHSPTGLHTIRDMSWDPSEDIAMQGVLDAAFSGVGAVALQLQDGNCAVVWTDSDARVEIDDCSTSAELVADPNSDAAFLSNRGVISRVEPTGITQVATGDQLAFNPSTGAVFVASGDQLQQLDMGGTELWSIDVGSRVFDMDDLGDRGGVAVVTASGELTIFGADGTELSTNALPSSAKVVSNNSGRDLSLVLPDQVNFFTVVDGPKRVGVATGAPVANPFSD